MEIDRPVKEADHRWSEQGQLRHPNPQMVNGGPAETHIPTNGLNRVSRGGQTHKWSGEVSWNGDRVEIGGDIRPPYQFTAPLRSHPLSFSDL